MQAMGLPAGSWDRDAGRGQLYRRNGKIIGRVETLLSCCLGIAHRADGHWEKKVTTSPEAARQYVEEVAS